ncbi:chorismate-binding protein [Escherichia coli]
MQLIAEAEGGRRGGYGGAVGYFTAHGNFDTCIVIRWRWWKTVSPPCKPVLA